MHIVLLKVNDMKKEKGYNIAVIGATGNVGREILLILEERKFPISNIFALASKKSVGKKISLSLTKSIDVQNLEDFDFNENNIDIAFFCAGEEISKKYAEKVANTGCIVIDKSSLFRMDPDVPLIIPEINGNQLKQLPKKNIISTPNCTTIPLLLCLKPLDEKYKIKRVVITTFQSVSGTGKEAMDELYSQTKGYYEAEIQHLENDNLKGKVYPKQIAFNCIPQCDSFSHDGFTKEEDKVINETEKILNKKINMSVTCVRVPVFRCHAESVNIEFENKIDLEELYEYLDEQDGVVLKDRQNDGGYAVQTESVGTDCVFISRLRRDFSVNNGINFWLVCDNLRKGSALNGVQIAERLIKNI